MIEKVYNKIHRLIELHQVSIFVFFSSLFILISFAGTRLFLSDEATILNQFYNLIHGSLSIERIKIMVVSSGGLNIGGPYLLYGNHFYGKFSYSLLILSLPIYYILETLDLLYGAHFFILQLWALSGGIIAGIIAKNRRVEHVFLIGAISYFILIAINMYFFEPIYFPVWGDFLSIEFTNILISSFIVLFVYLFFRNFFGSKIAIFVSFFVIFATPVSFYAITLKHHSLSLLLTLATFYFFYKYTEKRDTKYIYSAYILAGLCLWTRVLDGIVLLVSLLIIDMFIFRRGIKYTLSVLIVIIISLVPFFSFNYLILGSPFSVVETIQSDYRSINASGEQDAIVIYNIQANPKVDNLKEKLGYDGDEEMKSDWLSILSYMTFLKLKNTLGIFLVSPFLIVASVFVLDRVMQHIKLNIMDKFLGLYMILLIISYKDYLISIITDTPLVFEYRYLLILYIILLYFALRVDKVKDLIESKLKTIIPLYGIILLLILIYFIVEFPVPFLNIYYYIALITSLFMILLFSIRLFVHSKRYAIDNLIIFTTALSLALSSFFLLFYYWFVSMTYMSPSQNYTILPVLQKILQWMYTMI